jgi:hypothetical protein
MPSKDDVLRELQENLLKQPDKEEGFTKDYGLEYYQNKIAEQAKSIYGASKDPEYWKIAAGKTPEVESGIKRSFPNLVGFPADVIGFGMSGADKLSAHPDLQQEYMNIMYGDLLDPRLSLGQKEPVSDTPLYTEPTLGSEWLAKKFGLPERLGTSTELASEIFGELLIPTPYFVGKALYGAKNLAANTLKSLGRQVPDLLDSPLLQKAVPLQLSITPKGPRLTVPTDKPVYHVTHSEYVDEIKQRGLLHFYKPTNWDIGATGERYNPNSGIFAFENPEDALKWSVKMGDAFGSPVSIIKLKRQKGFEADPSEDPTLIGGKGKSLVQYDEPVPKEDIMESFELGFLGKEKPSMLKGKQVTYEQWVESWRQKLAGPGKKSAPKEKTLDPRGFYLKSYEAAKDFPEDLAGNISGAQFRKYLKKKGISDSELKWLELEELFQNPKITKQQVLDTIDKNRIELDVKIARESSIGGNTTAGWTETAYGLPLKSTLDELDKLDYEDQKRQVIFDNLFDDSDIIGKPTGQLKTEGADSVHDIPVPSSDKIFIPLSKSFLKSPQFEGLSGAQAKPELIKEIAKRRKIIKKIVGDKITAERYINGSEFNRMYEELSQIHTNVLKDKIPHEQFIENLIDSKQKLNKLIEKEKLRAQTRPEYYNAINRDLDPLIDEMSDIVVHQRFIGDPLYLRYEDVLSNTQLEKVTKSKGLEVHVDKESGYHIIGNNNEGWEIYKGKPNFKEGDPSRFRRYSDTPNETRKRQLESAGDWDLTYNYSDDPNLAATVDEMIADLSSVKVFDNLNEAKVQARNLYNQSQGIPASEGRIRYSGIESDPEVLPDLSVALGHPGDNVIERIEGKTYIKKGYGEGIEATRLGSLEGHFDPVDIAHFRANVIDAGNGETAYYPYELQSDALKVANKYGVYDKLPVSVRKQKAEKYVNDWENFLTRLRTIQQKNLDSRTTELILRFPSTGVSFGRTTLLKPQQNLSDVTLLLRNLERRLDADTPSVQKAMDDLINIKKNLEDDIASMTGKHPEYPMRESEAAALYAEFPRPELPLLDIKDSGKIVEANLKQALRDAAQRGDDWFVLPESEFHTNLWASDIRDEYYDTKLLKKIANKKTTQKDFKGLLEDPKAKLPPPEYRNMGDTYEGYPIRDLSNTEFNQLQKDARRVLWQRQLYNEIVPGSASKIADEIGGTFEKKFFKALEGGDTKRSMYHDDLMRKANDKYPKQTADEDFDDLFFGIEEGTQTKRDAYVDWLRNRANPGAGKYKYRKETIDFVPGERMAMRLTPEIRKAILEGGFKLPLKEGGVVPSNEGIMSVKDRAVNMFQDGGGVYGIKDKAVNMFRDENIGSLEDMRFEPKRISDFVPLKKTFEEIEEEKRIAELMDNISGVGAYIPNIKHKKSSLEVKPYFDVRGGISKGDESFIDEEGRPTTVDTRNIKFGGTAGIEILFPNKWTLKGGFSGNYFRGKFGEKSFGEGLDITGGGVELQIPLR